MGFVAGEELGELGAEAVFGIAADVVELINGDEAVIESRDAELFHGETEGRVGADEDAGRALEELGDGFDFGLRDADVAFGDGAMTACEMPRFCFLKSRYS